MEQLPYTQAPVPQDEEQRLKSLYNLKILDTPPEQRFDRITEVALQLFNVPISTVTLVDSRREWFKSCQGLSNKEGERAISFCGHALLADETFIIPDAKEDPRFAQNPMVIGKPYIRFYAGIPLKSADGKRIGAFCIKDYTPRNLTETQISLLKSLAMWAELELNIHELSTALEYRRQAEKKISELNDILKLLNKILRHDVLNDLTVIKGEVKLYLDGKTGKEEINHVFTAVNRSANLIEQMRELETAVSSGASLKEYKVRQVIDDAAKRFPEILITITGNEIVLADEALTSVIENLIRNALVHGKTTKMDINIEKKDNFVEIRVADYGTGIPDDIKGKLFTEGFKYGQTGHTGLGLYIVKKTLERYGGTATVADNKPNGTMFILTLQQPTTPPNIQAN